MKAGGPYPFVGRPAARRRRRAAAAVDPAGPAVSGLGGYYVVLNVRLAAEERREDQGFPRRLPASNRSRWRAIEALCRQPDRRTRRPGGARTYEGGGVAAENGGPVFGGGIGGMGVGGIGNSGSTISNTAKIDSGSKNKRIRCSESSGEDSRREGDRPARFGLTLFPDGTQAEDQGSGAHVCRARIQADAALQVARRGASIHACHAGIRAGVWPPVQ